MGVDAVFTPKVIEENPFPQEGVSDTTSTQSTSQSTGGQVFRPETTVEQTFPSKKVAVELLSVALNTKSKKVLQEFELTQSGGFQIGRFQSGVSGDVRITPNGITARDSSGNDTFSIDGSSGDAIFSGELRSRSLITGDVAVGDGNILIDGGNRRMIWFDEATGLPIIVIGNVG